MNELTLHSQTKNSMESFLKAPSHALIIDGADGVGKSSLANYIASYLLSIDESKLKFAHLLRLIPDESNNISIDEIRKARQFMLLKTLGTKPIRRVLIIEEADKLSIEAQNAFLKLLEEPPNDTVILLTTANVQKLLPTIRSRVQSLYVKTLAKKELVKYFSKKNYKVDDIERAYYIAEGRIGLMSSILKGGGESTLEQIDKAKQLLSSKKFERLLIINEVAKQKSTTMSLLNALDAICHTALAQASERGQNDQIKRWHQSLKTVSNVQVLARGRPNMKLLLTELALNL